MRNPGLKLTKDRFSAKHGKFEFWGVPLVRIMFPIFPIVSVVTLTGYYCLLDKIETGMYRWHACEMLLVAMRCTGPPATGT